MVVVVRMMIVVRMIVVVRTSRSDNEKSNTITEFTNVHQHLQRLTT